MSTVDERLERLFTDVAVEPMGDSDVFAAVARKRQQRHTRRVARNVVAAVALLVVLGGSLAWLTADRGTEPAVAPTKRDSVPRLRDAWLGARPIELAPGLGYVRGPLVQSGDGVSLASYDRDGRGGFKVPPSHVVRVDASGRAIGKAVQLQGEILSLAEGEGARWVVTHDGTNVATRLYRVKRIAPDNEVRSNEFPPDEAPTGSIVAAAGAAWVPVDGGVLRFDAATGSFVEKVELAGWRLPQLVQAGSEVYAYNPLMRPGDGSALGQVARLSIGASPTIVRTGIAPLSVTASGNGAWAAVGEGGRSVIVPVDLSTGHVDRARAVELPRRFFGSQLQGVGNTLWVRGSFTDKQAGIARIEIRPNGRGVAGDAVLFRAPNNADVLGLDGNDVLVAADGALYRVDIRS
jgi:hypothetical protein